MIDSCFVTTSSKTKLTVNFKIKKPWVIKTQALVQLPGRQYKHLGTRKKTTFNSMFIFNPFPRCLLPLTTFVAKYADWCHELRQEKQTASRHGLWPAPMWPWVRALLLGRFLSPEYSPHSRLRQAAKGMSTAQGRAERTCQHHPWTGRHTIRRSGHGTLACQRSMGPAMQQMTSIPMSRGLVQPSEWHAY